MLRLEQVSKVYQRGSASIIGVDRVSLEVAEGEFCAFRGPSGCGKSTLLNLVAGLDSPTTGEIILNGRPTGRFSSDDWTRVRREDIGIVFQAFHLIPGLSAEENVAFPLLLRGERGGAMHKRVEEVLNLVGMSHRRHHRPGELSGGEQQRIAIARAVVHSPKLVVADEPTGNLDSHQGAAVVDLLKMLADQEHRTVLLATHSGEAAGAAHYVWTMKDGRLIERVAPNLLSLGR
ncbi:MAG: conserved protein of unknown function [Nitrospira sp.]